MKDKKKIIDEIFKIKPNLNIADIINMIINSNDAILRNIMIQEAYQMGFKDGGKNKKTKIRKRDI